MTSSRIALFTAALGLAALPTYAAGVTQLSSAGQLSSADIVAVYPTQVNIVTGAMPENSPYQAYAGADTITFSDDGGFDIDSTDIGFDNENLLTGASIFPQGTTLLDNAPSLGVGTDTTTINFGIPVSEFGVLAYSEDDMENTFSYSLYDGSTLLNATPFTVSNDPNYTGAPPDPNLVFNTAFLGASAPGNEITSVVVSDANNAGFVLGPLTSTAVPEPAPAALMALGLCGLLPLVLRRRRA